jgi:hypothetical protein
MGLSLGTNRFLPRIFALGCLLGVTGCGTGVGVSSVTGVLDPGGSANQPVVAAGAAGASASNEKVLQSELRAYCPRVTLRSNAVVYDTFEKKGEEDATKLVYRSSLMAVTRKCSYAPGTMTMDVAVAGRVVPGPLAKDGSVAMPIKIEVKRGDEVLYSNVAKYEVAVSKAMGATQFIFNDPNVTFATPEPGTLQVYAGYDLPPKKKAEDEF